MQYVYMYHNFFIHSSVVSISWLLQNSNAMNMGFCVQSLQSYPTLCDPMDYSPPGSSFHRIFQARIL